MNILALDIGDKKIGIASSESGIIASELSTIKNNESALVFLADLITQRKIENLIVGLPVLKSGKDSRQSQKIKVFIRQLLAEVKISVIYENEYLTSVEAERILKELGLNQEQIKFRVDQMSAKLILEQFINHQ